MAQSKILLAFRARLRSRGYSDISIRFAIHPLTGEIRVDSFGNTLYSVTATEPLLDYQVCFVASEPQMANWPGISFGSSGYFTRQYSFDDFDEFGGAVFE